MRARRLGEYAALLGGSLNGPAAATVEGFATDSREAAPGILFLAIRGAHVDGHDFVPQALAAGAVAAVVERRVEGPHILVKDLVSALGRMAGRFRDEFTGPVVGITGSAGKTTTKELVAAALSPLGPVLKTRGNRNTEYTAPLLWAEAEPGHRAAVVEMAMRGFGQIAHLASFSRPTVGIVTNIGFSHLEQVGSRKGIAQAKAELLEALPEEGTAVLWHGDLFLDLLRSRSRARRIRTFGFCPSAECQIESYRALGWHTSEVVGTVDGDRWEVRLPFVGRHLALNAAAAVLVARELGVEPQRAADAMAGVELPPMRMEVRPLNGGTVLLDTYNASPPAMLGAIETLAEIPVDGRRLAVIGEMKELGEHGREAHRSVGAALHVHGIDRILFYGDAMADAWNEYVAAGGEPTRFSIAHSIDDVRRFLGEVEAGDAVLVKGSRALELERALEEPAER
jgi:UDP-N-acetylmuramoyl-tripeptide--D-alanyl-D-alanine ligase